MGKQRPHAGKPQTKPVCVHLVLTERYGALRNTQFLSNLLRAVNPMRMVMGCFKFMGKRKCRFSMC